jgi:glycosyltransferase involved in cell wall biosynthesis
MNIDRSQWICCQLGARENYAIPRVLFQHNKLARLITDAWVTPRSPINRLPQSLLPSLRERFHSELAQATVCSFNNSLFNFELSQKLNRNKGWSKIIDRNNWFQEQAVKALKKYSSKISAPITIFAYSYTALELFRYAKEQGWRTILGQIDAGLIHQEIVDRELNKHPQYRDKSEYIIPKYWHNWQEECLLADKIIVNSLWSQQALIEKKVPLEKVTIIPLVYETSIITESFLRKYPVEFSQKNPLKVLFLGRITLSKGVASVFEAIELLKNQPVEFWFVGSININIPQHIKQNDRVKWVSAIPRSQTSNYYKQADIFLFPTLSDGFGLTQLEAQAWQLPIIASKFCGSVVKDKINGLILPSVTGQAIAEAILFCLNNPKTLSLFSQQSTPEISNFSFLNLTQNLNSLESW